MKTANPLLSIRQHPGKVNLFFAIFYLVGIAGMLLPTTFSLFVGLIPFALLLSATTLALFHPRYSLKSVLTFILIYATGFTIEAIGVRTGAVFGPYIYGGSLGVKLFGTPLIIGLNWLLLVYLSASVLEKYNIHPVFKILGASTIMIGYDLIVEQIAPVLDMWHWTSKIVPLQNYIVWFCMAVVFHTLLKFLKVKTENRLASVILACQLLFFVALFVSFKILR